mgnify:CR=1 FL=1
MTIKVWSVYTGKLCFASYGKTASATHSRTIDHDRVHADNGFDVVFFCSKADELHHDQRSDSDYFVILVSFPNEFFQSVCYKAFFTIASIVCHHYQFVTGCFELILQDHKILVTESYDGMDFCTHLMKFLSNRIGNGTSYTAADNGYFL